MIKCRKDVLFLVASISSSMLMLSIILMSMAVVQFVLLFLKLIVLCILVYSVSFLALGCFPRLPVA